MYWPPSCPCCDLPACLPVCCAVQLLLSQHDLELGSHLQQLGVPLLERVWRHMSGAMSDLLPDADDWLVLWDHILAAPAGPCFYYSVLCSYLISQRQHLLQAVTDEQLTQLFAARPPVDIRKVKGLGADGGGAAGRDGTVALQGYEQLGPRMRCCVPCLLTPQACTRQGMNCSTRRAVLRVWCCASAISEGLGVLIQPLPLHTCLSLVPPGDQGGSAAA